MKLTTATRYKTSREVYVFLELNGACLAWGMGAKEPEARAMRLNATRELYEAIGAWIAEEEKELAK